MEKLPLCMKKKWEFTTFCIMWGEDVDFMLCFCTFQKEKSIQIYYYTKLMGSHYIIWNNNSQVTMIRSVYIELDFTGVLYLYKYVRI